MSILKIFTVFGVLLCPFGMFSKSIQKVDSIRIMGLKEATEYCGFNLSKQDFYQYIKKLKNDSAEFKSVVDTIIVQKNDIDSLLLLFSKSKKHGKTKYSTKEAYCVSVYSPELNYLGWSSVEDYRILIILFYGKHYDFVWLSTSYLEKGNFQYHISNELVNYLRKYSQCYDW